MTRGDITPRSAVPRTGPVGSRPIMKSTLGRRWSGRWLRFEASPLWQTPCRSRMLRSSEICYIGQARGRTKDVAS